MHLRAERILTGVTAKRIREAAASTLGFTSLRPGQADAIQSVLDGVDTLVIMPTGFGKSAIYQIAGTLTEGPTLVISPLVALEFDQVRALAEHPTAPRAVTVNSSQSDSANEAAWTAIADGEAEFLLVAPEQLAKPESVARLKDAGCSLVVVDEAHCVASWGSDFRPDYLRIASVVEELGRPTILALTATAASPVRREIVERLGMRDVATFPHGFDRPELRFEVRRHADDDVKHEAVVGQVRDAGARGIVYAGTRADTELLAELLGGAGVSASAYHAGLKAKERRSTAKLFADGDVDVVVATSAFGMGIDIPDLRFVVHASIPESVDAYYQQAGRAGRDGEDAVVTLHYREEDLGQSAFFSTRRYPRKKLVRVFEAVVDLGEGATSDAVAERAGMTPRTVERYVNLLVQARALDREEGDVLVPLVERAAEAVTLGERQARQTEAIERSRVEMMRRYAETRGCRRQEILGYFGEDLPEPCGNCDTCSSGSAYEEEDERSEDGDAAPGRFADGTTVRHAEWGEGRVMEREDDRLTVFFDTVGYRTLDLETVEERGLLEPVG